MATLRSITEIVGELALETGGRGQAGVQALQEARGDQLPIVLDATASMPARAAGTMSLTPQQVLAAFGTPSDAWGSSGALAAVYIYNGRGTGQTGWPAITGAPAGTIGGIWGGPQPINPNVATPLFWVRLA